MSLFVRMLREEWRLHAELFGGDRFGAFPLAVGALTAAATWLLAETSVAPLDVAAGLHGLVLFFGLQVGTIGLIGRDALRDVFDDVTMLVFSARTLPLSWRRLLGTFLVKDLCYYSALVVTPVIAGFGAVAVARGVPPSTVALAWATVSLSFALGAALSLSLAALATRSALAVLLGLAVAVGAVLTFDLDPLTLTPYRLFVAPSATTLATALGPIAALAVVGVWLFEPAESEADAGRHRLLEAALTRVAPDALTRRPLLAVSRSSGSVAKVAFSMGVLFAVVALVLDRVSAATGLEPAAGIAFGALLGLGAFTTYSWVSVFDDPREYLRYPIAYERVFAGKRRAYLLLSVGAGLGYLALATLWYPVGQLLVGAVVLPLVAVYVFGVAAYLTGLSPNELLFDTPLFLVFGAALAAVALPLLVAALASAAAPTLATGVAVAISLLAGLLGVGLNRLAGPRWDERLLE